MGSSGLATGSSLQAQKVPVQALGKSGRHGIGDLLRDIQCWCQRTGMDRGGIGGRPPRVAKRHEAAPGGSSGRWRCLSSGPSGRERADPKASVRRQRYVRCSCQNGTATGVGRATIVVQSGRWGLEGHQASPLHWYACSHPGLETGRPAFTREVLTRVGALLQRGTMQVLGHASRLATV